MAVQDALDAGHGEVHPESRAASKSPYRFLSCSDANEDKLRPGVNMAVLSGASSRQVTPTWAEDRC